MAKRPRRKPVRRVPNASGIRPAIPRPEEVALRTSALKIIEWARNEPGLDDRHRRIVIDRMIWSLTEETYGKHTVPYRSRAAASLGRGDEVIHEHVFPREWLIDRVIDGMPEADIVRHAVACLVREHEANTKLKAVEKLHVGWARYKAAEIEVVQVDAKGTVTPIAPWSTDE